MKRRRGGAVALWFASVGVGLVIIVAIAFRDAAIEWWYRIPVTRTRGDLLAQRPIDLGDGTTVRLGIEARRCPRWSGVLVYGLFEGQSDGVRRTAFSPRASERLGSLGIEVSELDAPKSADGPGKQVLEVLSHEMEVEPDARGSRPRLSTCRVHILHPGRHRVAVLDRSGEELRVATVTGTDAEAPPWSPIDMRRSRSTRSETPTIRLAVGGAGVALPAANDWPALASETGKGVLLDPQQDLPRLVPREPSPGLRLDGEGTLLTLRSAEDIVTSLPETHFLARWWVNGEPWVPEFTVAGRARESIAREVTGRTLRLELDFDNALLRSRSGDRVVLQLLYVDSGWDLVAPDPGPERHLRRLGPGERRTLLTERVEIVAP